jgi:hypothetical protein
MKVKYLVYREDLFSNTFAPLSHLLILFLQSTLSAEWVTIDLLQVKK